VDGVVDQPILKGVVRSAVQLVSVVFINCPVIKSRAIGITSETLPSPVDVDVFVETISKGRGADTSADVLDAIVVSGTLEGELLGEFRSLFENRK